MLNRLKSEEMHYLLLLLLCDLALASLMSFLTFEAFPFLLARLPRIFPCFLLLVLFGARFLEIFLLVFLGIFSAR